MKKLKILFILLIIFIFSSNNLFAQRYSTWFTATDTSVVLPRTMPYYSLFYINDTKTFYVSDSSLSSNNSIGSFIGTHLFSNFNIRDTFTIGNVHSPTSIFEVKDLIKFNGTNVYFGDSAGIGSSGDKNIYIGKESGKNSTGNNNLLIGYQAGYYNTSSSSNNTLIGYQAGSRNTTGGNNTSLGFQSLFANTTGGNNTAIGSYAGKSCSIGSNNTYLGYYAGQKSYGSENLMLGSISGYNTTNGQRNVFVGRASGYTNTSGSYNIFIGYYAGYNETGSNKLYIENSNSTTPLIYGEFDNDFIKINGGFAKDYDIKTDNYTITLGDYTIEEQTSTKTITLPTGTKAGQEYVIVNTSGGTITISTDGSDYIDNTGTNTTYTISSGDAIVVAFNGVDRWTIH